MNTLRKIRNTYRTGLLLYRVIRSAWRTAKKAPLAHMDSDGRITVQVVPEVTEEELEMIMEGYDGEPN